VVLSFAPMNNKADHRRQPKAERRNRGHR